MTRRRRTCLTVVLVTMGAFVAAVVALFGLAVYAVSSAEGDELTLQKRVASPDGRFELRVLGGSRWIDWEADVRLASGEQSVMVWDGAPESMIPKTVRFTGPNGIEIVTDTGCRFHSTFDPKTLRVHPVHVMDRYQTC